MNIAYIPAGCIVIGGISFFAALFVAEQEPKQKTLGIISSILLIGSVLIGVGSYLYGLSIADVNVKCTHYQVIDIKDNKDAIKLVLKTDEGGYFEIDGSLADQYELKKGDDYWTKETISTVDGVPISSNYYYAYTCVEGPERIER